MPEPTWRIGAFADRFTEAREIGYAHQTETRALEALYATAGQRTMIGVQPCCESGGCCCFAPPAEDGFAGIFTEAAWAISEGRAFAAALRDITADQDLEDVVGAVAIATKLHGAGELAPLYEPAVPTRTLPDGSEPPARCPICGALACATCGRVCLCIPMKQA